MKIGKYIHLLLLENNLVIIPGFGAFVAEYKPAEITPESDEIAPPSKKISFNQQIRNNDGLLVGYVAENTRCSHFEALQKIEKERDNIIFRLDKGEKVLLEEVGTLYFDANQDICFTSQEEKNVSLESFGLDITDLTAPAPKKEEPVPSAKVDEPKKETPIIPKPQKKPEAQPKISTPPPAIAPIQPKKKRKPLWLLLLLIPLLGAAAYYYLVIMKNTVPPQEEVLNTPTEQTTFIDSVESSQEDSTFIAEKGDTVLQVQTDTIPQNITDTVPNQKYYYLITGSFSVKENATAYVDVLKDQGFEAFYAGKRGRFYCVGIGKYLSFKDAETVKDTIVKNHPELELWVWKK